MLPAGLVRPVWTHLPGRPASRPPHVWRKHRWTRYSCATVFLSSGPVGGPGACVVPDPSASRAPRSGLGRPGGRSPVAL